MFKRAGLIAWACCLFSVFWLADIAAAAVTVDGLTYSIQKVYVTSTYGPEFMTEKASGEFIVIRVTVSNVGKSPADISASDFHLKRGDIKYDAAATMATMGGSDGFFLTKLNPGVSRSGTILFDVPASTAPSKYQLIVFGNGTGQSKNISL